MTEQVPTCPECNSTKTWKDGTRQTEHRKVQRYYCRNCGYRFSEPNLMPPNKPKPVQSNRRMPLNTTFNLLFDRQICVSKTKAAKNLVKVETRTENRLAGATKIKSELKGKIIEFPWWMKKEGYEESTILTREQMPKTSNKTRSKPIRSRTNQRNHSHPKMVQQKKKECYRRLHAFLKCKLNMETPRYKSLKNYRSYQQKKKSTP